MSESNTLDKNFIQKIIDDDNITNKWDKRVHTRFLQSQTDICILGMLNRFA